MREKLETRSLAELKEMAKNVGLKGISGLRKAELIDLLCAQEEKSQKNTAETVTVKPHSSRVNAEKTVREKPVQETRSQETHPQENRVQESRVQENRSQENRVQETRPQENRYQEKRSQDNRNNQRNNRTYERFNQTRPRSVHMGTTIITITTIVTALRQLPLFSRRFPSARLILPRTRLMSRMWTTRSVWQDRNTEMTPWDFPHRIWQN